MTYKQLTVNIILTNKQLDNNQKICIMEVSRSKTAIRSGYFLSIATLTNNIYSLSLAQKGLRHDKQKLI